MRIDRKESIFTLNRKRIKMSNIAVCRNEHQTVTFPTICQNQTTRYLRPTMTTVCFVLSFKVPNNWNCIHTCT